MAQQSNNDKELHINPPGSEMNIGARMPDGTVYAGISPDTNKPMYATPADASLTMTFNDAQRYAAKLDAFDHTDWHVPTKAELNVLFNNRVAIGGLIRTGSYPSSYYWSSEPFFDFAWYQKFSNGDQNCVHHGNQAVVRCVR